ncbi:MAG: GDP-mannose 4,6-dehydratase [Chloroflexia bacterium]|nr:GDP-mannose 4,6-dehydratase [Chloroflexia bacterium]
MNPHSVTPPADFWLERRVLVTGATGLIGSWLVQELLARGALVVALVRDVDPRSELYRSGAAGRIHVVNGALEDFAVLERAINLYETETVFHLGAQSQVVVAQRYPLATLESNIRGTYNLLEACRVHRGIVGRVLIASSDKAYGAHERLPYTEDMALLGRHPYEVSKSCADLLAQAYHHSYELPVAIARCGNVYGGGDLNWARLVPGVIRAFLQGVPPVIRSDGRYERDYIYVRDVARAYMQLAEAVEDERVRGGAFNFGHQRPLSVLDMVAAIARLMPAEAREPEVLDAAVGEIQRQHLSAERARAVLGWRPAYSLEEGLRETIAWYRRYFVEESE